MSRLRECEVISLRKIEGDGNLKAFADIRVGGGLVIKGCTIMNGRNGLFANMPRQVDKVGTWHDVVVPVDDELKAIYRDSLMQSYETRQMEGC